MGRQLLPTVVLGRDERLQYQGPAVVMLDYDAFRLAEAEALGSLVGVEGGMGERDECVVLLLVAGGGDEGRQGAVAEVQRQVWVAVDKVGHFPV